MSLQQLREQQQRILRDPSSWPVTHFGGPWNPHDAALLWATRSDLFRFQHDFQLVSGRSYREVELLLPYALLRDPDRLNGGNFLDMKITIADVDNLYIARELRLEAS